MVAVPAAGADAPDENYNMSCFIYNEKNDTYTCPQQQVLTTNANWYKKSRETNQYTVKHYKTHACAVCATKALCTSAPKGRLIERSEYAPYIEINKCNIEANPLLYKKRQCIAEHPYGTIKRQWGFDHIITKKWLKRASADAGFMFVAYNLRRIMNIVDKKLLSRFLQQLVFLFFTKRTSSKHFIFKIKRSFLNIRSQHQFYLSGQVKL